MPLPRWVAHANKRFTNRLVGPVVRRFPSHAVIGHSGRRTGRPYRTPVSLFSAGGVFYVALTYGHRADWVRNVLAGGGTCERRDGRKFRIDSPTLVGRDEVWPHLSRVVRFFLIIVHVTGFLRFRVEDR